ncbi:hypothetical protein V8B97DRAFT_1141378 [Scleroderma yunnanense]
MCRTDSDKELSGKFDRQFSREEWQNTLSYGETCTAWLDSSSSRCRCPPCFGRIVDLSPILLVVGLGDGIGALLIHSLPVLLCRSLISLVTCVIYKSLGLLSCLLLCDSAGLRGIYIFGTGSHPLVVLNGENFSDPMTLVREVSRNAWLYWRGGD